KSPLDVEIIAIPKPSRTFGTSLALTYTLSPGLEILFNPEIIFSPFSVYFNSIVRIPCLLSSSTLNPLMKPSSRRICAIAFFSLEYGSETLVWFALLPFLILVSISAIGSVIIVFVLLNYQLAFLTPGISPLFASSLTHIRQIPYFLKTECGLPQILHLL